MSTAIKPAPTMLENMKAQLKKGITFSKKTTAPKALKLHSRHARAQTLMGGRYSSRTLHVLASGCHGAKQ